MLSILKNKKAQAVSSEYAIILSMVLAMTVAMGVYFKRAVQARMHDARDYMVSEVKERTDGVYTGDLYIGYEPYYTETMANVTRQTEDNTRLLPGESSGIFKKQINELSTMKMESETLPPKMFNATTPPSSR
jgi:uncharacterized protein YpmB